MSKEVRVVANWKMHKTIPQAIDFIKKLPELKTTLSIAVPYTMIHACAKFPEKQPLLCIGAQNMHYEIDGPYTGEVSSKQILDAGAEFVLLGHSERRHFFNETNEFVNKKVRQALLNNLVVILCIGETLTEREQGKTIDILEEQLLKGLNEVDPNLLGKVMIAYEPVWAIGTGEAATPQMAQEAHFNLRKIMTDKWGEKISDQMYLLHGGSIKPENIEELTSQQDIDGVLVGGASLTSETFNEIIQKAGSIKK